MITDRFVSGSATTYWTLDVRFSKKPFTIGLPCRRSASVALIVALSYPIVGRSSSRPPETTLTRWRLLWRSLFRWLRAGPEGRLRPIRRDKPEQDHTGSMAATKTKT